MPFPQLTVPGDCTTYLKTAGKINDGPSLTQGQSHVCPSPSTAPFPGLTISLWSPQLPAGALRIFLAALPIFYSAFFPHIGCFWSVLRIYCFNQCNLRSVIPLTEIIPSNVLLIPGIAEWEWSSVAAYGDISYLWCLSWAFRSFFPPFSFNQSCLLRDQAILVCFFFDKTMLLDVL